MIDFRAHARASFTERVYMYTDVSNYRRSCMLSRFYQTPHPLSLSLYASPINFAFQFISRSPLN